MIIKNNLVLMQLIVLLYIYDKWIESIVFFLVLTEICAHACWSFLYLCLVIFSVV